MGHTQSSSYMISDRFGNKANPESFFPTLGNVQSSCKAYDSSFVNPAALQRSKTTLSWKPNNINGTERETDDSQMYSRSKLGDLGSAKLTPEFAATRNGIHTKYTPEDWQTSNSSYFSASDRSRSAAELMRMDASRVCREACDKTRKTQNESTKKLGDRVGDTEYWKKEVQNELDSVIQETADLQKVSDCVEKALAETEEPFNITRQCLMEREKRTGIDLVNDEVEKQLLKELENFQVIQEELRQQVHEAKNQILLNNTAQRQLENDSADKFAAINRDRACHELRNTSKGLQFFNGIERVDNTISDPETWVKFSCDNIQRSQNERASSRGVRDRSMTLLKKQAESLVNQWNAVNIAFSNRIQEYMNAKDKLQTHLSKVLQELFDTEKTIELLKKCLKDKTAPMQVAQTRLMTRSDRPNMESCKDPAQHRLVFEVNEIAESVEQVQAKLREAENTHANLLRTRIALEHDLAIKNNSIFIDREKCMGLRKSYRMSPRVFCG